MAVGYATGGRTPCDPRHKSKNASQGRSQSRNLERSCSGARRARGLARAALLYLVRASVIQCKLQPVAANSIASFHKLATRGRGALTVQMPILAGRLAHRSMLSNRSIVMPPSIVITAMPVKGIIDPTRVRTVWRSPKRVSPHGTDHAADDCSRRSGDDKSSSGAESRADCVRSRTRRRNRHQRDGRAC
jgi:hypothetical protein